MSGNPAGEVYIPPYDMSHKSRGQVLIFNNQNYPNFEKRLYSVRDEKRITASLVSLGYHPRSIRKFPDCTAKQMLKAIKEVAWADHTDSDSVVIVFLCYGEQNLIMASDQQIGLQNLLWPLKGDQCHESLVGKPKLIILQSCNPTTKIQTNDKPEAKTVHCVPPEADFAYLGTEVPGNFPNRKIDDGSLFIEHLTIQLDEARKSRIELRQVMTRTLAAVAAKMDEECPEWCNYDDRMPYFINMLTKDLYFCKENKY